jgi:hypothetical protein
MIRTYVVIVKFSSIINQCELVAVDTRGICPTNPVASSMYVGISHGFEGMVDSVDFLFHDIQPSRHLFVHHLHPTM